MRRADDLPSGSSAARHASAVISECTTDRGKRRSSSMNSAARSWVAAAPYARRNASCAPHERSTSAQAGPDAPRRSSDASIRAVMSTRSIERPSTRKCHGSSRLMLESAMPPSTATRSRTQSKNRCGRRLLGRRPGASELWVVLSDSHSSVEMISRARRAFSRAARSEPTIEPGAPSYASRPSMSARVICRVTSGSMGAPITPRSTRQDESSSSQGSSSSSCRWTSRMRAVPSARSR